jgi:hypothetical protein
MISQEHSARFANVRETMSSWQCKLTKRSSVFSVSQHLIIHLGFWHIQSFLQGRFETERPSTRASVKLELHQPFIPLNLLMILFHSDETEQLHPISSRSQLSSSCPIS